MKEITIKEAGNGKLMTIPEVAEALGVSEKTVRRTITRLNAKNSQLDSPDSAFQLLGKTTIQGSHGGSPKTMLAGWEFSMIKEAVETAHNSGLARARKDAVHIKDNAPLMTIAELAELLHVNEKTVRRTISHLNDNFRNNCQTFKIGKMAVRDGIPKLLFNELEAGMLTEELKKAHNSGLAKIPKVDQPITKFEEDRLIDEGLQILNNRLAAGMEEIKKADNSGLAKIPKVDRPLTKLEEDQFIDKSMEILQARMDAYSGETKP